MIGYKGYSLLSWDTNLDYSIIFESQEFTQFHFEIGGMVFKQIGQKLTEPGIGIYDDDYGHIHLF